MYEIKENRRELFDGTEITTYTRDVVSANHRSLWPCPIILTIFNPDS